MAWQQTGSLKGPKGDKGDQGIQGPKGDKGDDGVGIEIGGSVDTYAELSGLGLGAGDAGTGYLNKADGKLYIWDGSAWPADGDGADFRGPKGDKGDKGDPGEKGEKGDQGIQGITGSAGADGQKGDPGEPNTLTIGTVQATDGSPSATITGTSPNQVLNLTLKTGAKGDPGSTGAKGEKGDKGDTGARGSRWYVGTGAPTSISGSAVGDFYLDNDTGQYYELI